MEKAIYLSLLLDFYGELLTEKQREYADLYYNENLSLREIAENDGISRQAVRDALLRAEATLRETEEKTGLFQRHTELLKQVEAAEVKVREIADNDGISRQAVRDTLLRAESVLRETEEKTGLLARHTKLLQQIAEAETAVQELEKLNAEHYQDARLLSLCAELESKLEQMKL